MARVVHPKQHWASHWVRCGPMLGAQRLCGLRVVGNFRIPCSFSHPADAQCYCHTSLGRRIIKSYRSVPARAHRILSFMRLLIIYSRFGLRFASHGSRIRIAPALLAFSSVVGWVSGVRFDGEPPRVSVCISEAVRPRNEVLPQGNADVPSRTTAGRYQFFFQSLRFAFAFPQVEVPV